MYQTFVDCCRSNTEKKIFIHRLAYTDGYLKTYANKGKQTRLSSTKKKKVTNWHTAESCAISSAEFFISQQGPLYLFHIL